MDLIFSFRQDLNTSLKKIVFQMYQNNLDLYKHLRSIYKNTSVCICGMIVGLATKYRRTQYSPFMVHVCVIYDYRIAGVSTTIAKQIQHALGHLGCKGHFTLHCAVIISCIILGSSYYYYFTSKEKKMDIYIHTYIISTYTYTCICLQYISKAGNSSCHEIWPACMQKFLAGPSSALGGVEGPGMFRQPHP